MKCSRPKGCPRPAAQALIKTIESLPAGELLTRQQAAERALLQMGITFNVTAKTPGPKRFSRSIFSRESFRRLNGSALRPG